MNNEEDPRIVKAMNVMNMGLEWAIVRAIAAALPKLPSEAEIQEAALDYAGHEKLPSLTHFKNGVHWLAHELGLE